MDMQGHTYERNAILSWLGANGTCPLSRRPMKASDLIPNVMMQTRVRLWQRETGQKVFNIASMWGDFGGGEDVTENESGSENDGDEFRPVYAVTIVPVAEESERRQRPSHSSRNSRRRHQHRRERTRPTEEPVAVNATPRRFRLCSSKARTTTATGRRPAR